jgi:hypothetical protein
LIRRATTDELRLIQNAWLKSYASSDWARFVTPRDDDHTVECSACGIRRLRQVTKNGITTHMAGPLYWERHHRLVESLLSSSNVSVAETNGVVDAWIVRDEIYPILHYVYSRWSARKEGHARALCEDLLPLRTRFTHWSRAIVGRRIPRGWIFDPYLLERVAA